MHLDMKKFGLLPRIAVAIVLGIVFGNFLPEGWVRVFTTFNYVFSQFLGFLIPLIIIGLVIPAIADIRRSAGRLLLLTVGLAYADTIVAGLLDSFGTACNVTGDGALAVIIDRLHSKAKKETVH